jgi:hypothetical protein
VIRFPDARPAFELAPAGSHLATLYAIVELGTQEIDYGEEVKTQPQIYLGFELPDELMADGRPFTVSKTYHFNSHPRAAFRQAVEGLLGRELRETEVGGFDIVSLLGSTAVANIQHKTARTGPSYAGLISLSPVPKGVERRREPFNEPLMFSSSPFDRAAYDALPS